MAHSSSIPHPTPLWKRWYSWVLLAVVVAAIVARLLHWDDRAQLWVSEFFESAADRHDSVWLPSYQVVIDAKVLPGMERDEASDITYNAATDSLFAVMGKNPFLVELTLEGDVVRKIPLNGWSNPEGVTALPGGRLAITDERTHHLTIVNVDGNTRELNIADFPQYDLGPSTNQNKAFEGIAWDPARQRLLLAEERPAKLFSWASDGSTRLEGNKVAMSTDSLDMRNLSAISIDPRTGHTLALSADSHLLLELDEKNEQVSFMTLLAGFNGLKDTIPRAEGVTIDGRGTVYIVSEPNLFYVLRKPSR